MSSMVCPNCGLYNAETALRCDCGYDFATEQLEASYLHGGHVAQGKSFGVRASAYIIDTVVLYVASFGVAMSVGFLIGVVMVIIDSDVTYSEQGVGMLDLAAGMLISILYFTLFEGLYGATLGKLVLGMRVVREDGRACGLGPALKRALWRLWDGLFFGLIGYSNMKPPLQQRRGDKSANTIVVDRKSPVIEEPRPWWFFVSAAVLFLVVQAGFTSFTLIRAMQ